MADEPTTVKEILKDTYKDNDTFQLMDVIYFVGMVADAAFEGNKSLNTKKIKSDYDGILIFGVTLKSRSNGLFPTRAQLAEISRALNRKERKGLRKVRKGILASFASNGYPNSIFQSFNLSIS